MFSNRRPILRIRRRLDVPACPPNRIVRLLLLLLLLLLHHHHHLLLLLPSPNKTPTPGTWSMAFLLQAISLLRWIPTSTAELLMDCHTILSRKLTKLHR